MPIIYRPNPAPPPPKAPKTVAPDVPKTPAQRVYNGCLTCCLFWLALAALGMMSNAIFPHVETDEERARDAYVHAEGHRRMLLEKYREEDQRAAEDAYLRAHGGE